MPQIRSPLAATGTRRNQINNLGHGDMHQGVAVKKVKSDQSGYVLID